MAFKKLKFKFPLICLVIASIISCIVAQVTGGSVRNISVPVTAHLQTNITHPTTTTTRETTTIKVELKTPTTIVTTIPPQIINHTVTVHKNHTEVQPSLLSKILKTIYMPIVALLRAPKVNTVLRNVGTCMVNGFMEIVSYYLPAPLIPIITSAAGQIFPFEPIMMLRDKMPVASYRRAFLTAIRTFLGTFDKYRIEDNFEDDPYMMNQFNRRMMRYSNEDKRSKKRNFT